MQSESERRALLAELHTLKTDIFMAMVEAGRMPLRPGVQRLVGAPSIYPISRPPIPYFQRLVGAPPQARPASCTAELGSLIN